MDYTDTAAMATAVYNAIYADPAIEPAACLADIEREGLPELVQQWETIRLALERMPDEVLTALVRLRGPNAERRPHLYVVRD